VRPAEISERYIKEYFTDVEGLGVRPATIHPRATENIPQIIDMIRTLMDKGYAYAAGGDVYYRTKKFEGYGRLSRQPLEELESGARIDVSALKEVSGFCPWKAAKPGEPSWDSRGAAGRPGWHIECSAMSSRYLGKPPTSIARQDLQFPITRMRSPSRGGQRLRFVNYCCHNGIINVVNKKIPSRRVSTLRCAGAAFPGTTHPVFYAQRHNRSPLNNSRNP
jgi:cysteinyl-tRNA synthetase